MKKRLSLLLLAFIVLVAAVWVPDAEEVSATSVKLNKTKVSIDVGATVKLKLKGAAGTIKWASDNKKIAKVSKKGVVTGVSNGTANITATFFGKKYTCAVTVTKIKLNYSKYELKEGESFELKFKGSISAKYRVVNENIAKVSAKGVVTGITIGDTVVYVKDPSGKEYKCKVSVVYNEANHVHKKCYISSKNATCTETGLTIGEYCETCGAVLREQQVLPAKGHNYGEDGICKTCGEMDPKYKPKHVHSLISVSKEATCTEDGHTEKVYCETCGEVLMQPKVIKATGHVYANGFCTKCGIAEIHEYVTVPGTAPTCVKAGRTDYVYCKHCGEVLKYAEDIPPLDHEYNGGDTCIRCGADKMGHIHTWVIQKAVAPTCTQVGYTEGKYCEVCGYVAYAQQFVSPLHHNFVNGKCTRCGALEQ